MSTGASWDTVHKKYIISDIILRNAKKSKYKYHCVKWLFYVSKEALVDISLESASGRRPQFLIKPCVFPES